MTLPVVSYPILSAEQANPLLYGLTQALKNNQTALQNENWAMENKYQEPQIQQKIKANELANSIAAINAKYAEQKTLEDLAHLRSSTGLNLSNINKTNALLPFLIQRQRENANNPLLTMSGPAGQIGAALFAQQHGLNIPGYGAPQVVSNAPGGIGSSIKAPQIEEGPNALAQSILNSNDVNTRSKIAQAQLNQKRANAYNFSILPVDEKSDYLAQLRGLGLNSSEQQEAILNNKTLTEIAQEKGIDPNYLPPKIYAATKANITQDNKRREALAGLKKLGDFVTEGIGPFSQSFRGVSPKFMADTLNNQNRDARVKYLAAIMTVPEVSATKLRALQGQVGIEAMRHVEENSMQNHKVLEILKSFIKPKDWIDAQKLSNQVIEATGAAENDIYNVNPAVRLSTKELLEIVRRGKNG